MPSDLLKCQVAVKFKSEMGVCFYILEEFLWNTNFGKPAFIIFPFWPDLLRDKRRFIADIKALFAKLQVLLQGMGELKWLKESTVLHIDKNQNRIPAVSFGYFCRNTKNHFDWHRWFLQVGLSPSLRLLKSPTGSSPEHEGSEKVLN